MHMVSLEGLAAIVMISVDKLAHVVNFYRTIGHVLNMEIC